MTLGADEFRANKLKTTNQGLKIFGFLEPRAKSGSDDSHLIDPFFGFSFDPSCEQFLQAHDVWRLLVGRLIASARVGLDERHSTVASRPE